MTPSQRTRTFNPSRRRARVAGVVVLGIVTAIVPSAVSAAPALSFGTVSVGSMKVLTRTVPLQFALSDLPAGTVIFSGDGGLIDGGLASVGLSVPLTNTEFINEQGDLSATYHLSGSLAAGTDFQIDAAGCASGTVSCTLEATFAPTATGTRTDTLNWQISGVQTTGGGSLGPLIGLLTPFIASSVVAQLSISLDGIGVPSTGGVSARVDIAASAACIELNTSSIDFGATTLGAENIAATPTITVSNCSGTGETLYARGTNAAGPSSAWTLVDSTATCANDLGLDNYRLGLDVGAVPVPLGLSIENKLVQSIGAGADLDQVARIWTACPGSTGAGVTMTMSIHYLVVSD